jgi:hypothetical protein
MDGVMFAISIFLAIAGPTLLALALYRGNPWSPTDNSGKKMPRSQPVRAIRRRAKEPMLEPPSSLLSAPMLHGVQAAAYPHQCGPGKRIADQVSLEGAPTLRCSGCRPS